MRSALSGPLYNRRRYEFEGPQLVEAARALLADQLDGMFGSEK